MQNLIEFHRFVHKIMRRNEIMAIDKGHNSTVDLQKLTRSNSNLDLVKVDVNAKFYLSNSPSICPQDIERKRKF